MGEAKRKLQKQTALVAASTRCVYCPNTTDLTCEHMPPRGMFKDKDRPRGWEFACCQRCNQGTRGADALAQFFAKIEATAQERWKLSSNVKLVGALERYAPGVMGELFGVNTWADTLLNRNGLLHRARISRADGRRTKHHLDLFAAKVAMAAFRNFTHRPIEMHGLIYSEWFLNGGLSREMFDAIVSVMPGMEQLTQGRKVSGKQFYLRYNTDGRDIVAAMVSFHDSLHITVIATDSEVFASPLSETFEKIRGVQRPTLQLVRPGLLELDQKI